jgi:hypothetical protein
MRICNSADILDKMHSYHRSALTCTARTDSINFSTRLKGWDGDDYGGHDDRDPAARTAMIVTEQK